MHGGNAKHPSEKRRKEEERGAEEWEVTEVVVEGHAMIDLLILLVYSFYYRSFLVALCPVVLYIMTFLCSWYNYIALAVIMRKVLLYCTCNTVVLSDVILCFTYTPVISSNYH